jgi:hypothetical protein
MKKRNETHHQPNVPKSKETLSTPQSPASSVRLRFRNLRVLLKTSSSAAIHHVLLFFLLFEGMSEGWIEGILTEIQIRLRRQHQRFRFDPSHGCGEIAVVGFLLRDVAALPRVQHCEHVFGIYRITKPIS